MEIVVYSQYYLIRFPKRQLEIDESLGISLNHPGISRMVMFCDSDVTPWPQGTVPVEVVSSEGQLTYAECFRWVQYQGSGPGLQLLADIDHGSWAGAARSQFQHAGGLAGAIPPQPGPRRHLSPLLPPMDSGYLRHMLQCQAVREPFLCQQISAGFPDFDNTITRVSGCTKLQAYIPSMNMDILNRAT